MELLLAAVVLVGLAAIFRSRSRKPYIWFDGALLRPEDLFAHGQELAKFHKTVKIRFSLIRTARRLKENFRFITQVYKDSAEDLRRGKDVVPAAQWLLDNYYVIEEQVREITRSLRGRRFQELPVLSNGHLRGNPRVYAIALELIAHTDGKLEEEVLINFVNAYQERAKLSTEEIWSLFLMVQIALVEKTRTACQLLAATHRQWRKAEELLAKAKGGNIMEILEGRLNPSFIEHLLELIRHQENDTREIRDALAEKLLDIDTTLDRLVHQEHQAEAARAASLGNAIISLKNAATLDWSEIFEALSPVDKVLRADRIYRKMDYDSRNYYRRYVQRIAKKARVSESRVAKLAMELAGEGEDELRKHCGYYLVDEGRETLGNKLGRRLSRGNISARAYILMVIALTLLLAAPAGLAGIAGYLLFLIPASEITVSFLNRILVHLKYPVLLPKLEYSEGVPKEAATLVVVPALLPDPRRARELVERLETHCLANPDSNLAFALLGDFKDSATQDREGDQDIIAAVAEGIQALREQHGQRFWGLIRRRSYSKTQKVWLGWERKRGALVELNDLLSGSNATSFLDIPDDLPKVRYVLTLDADSRLPVDMARKLVGTIAHPLHRAVLNQSGARVERGYGIIQPRIGVSLESVNQTLFAQVWAGPGGSDIYTTANSDVYQDWFGSGIFVGKGIYDLEIAHRILKDIPENSILSHDLLEGGLMRTGLATDLELVDDFPARYGSFIQRQHRWTRGDWQLAGWLGRRIRPGRTNPLSLLSRWQIFDNLRRSLVSLSLLLFFSVLLITQAQLGILILLFLAALALPPFLNLLEYNWPGYVYNLISRTRFPQLTGPRIFLLQVTLQLAFLPHQAWIYSDAIVRTGYRLLISRENLLEWTTAAEAEKKSGDSYYLRFLPVLAILAGLAVVIGILRPAGLAIYLPLLVLWILAPGLAGRISRLGQRVSRSLTGQDRRLLRKIARDIWNYYQDLACAETSYLPPDNFQVDPPNAIDYRTSPTNIGFYLLSLLAARDFGLITTLEMTTRVGQTLDSVERLSKWKGHLFNWYDTRDLELLRPWFVSTVDSGNFVAMLVALAQGLREYLDSPLPDSNLVLGITGVLNADFSPPEKITIKEWADLIADLQAGGELEDRAAHMLSMFRKELDALFPHTEILAAPPVFLAKEEKYSNLLAAINKIQANPSPRILADQYGAMLDEIDIVVDKAAPEQKDYLLVAKDDLLRVAAAAAGLVEEICSSIQRIDELVRATDFSALYNSRHLFSIGYSVDEEKLVESSYDLMASEARLTSYLAIIGRQVPVKHWQKTGRAVTRVDGARALVSWAGTMFEYLMPPLLLKNYANTLLDETIGTVIAAQQSYARKRNAPWGISESGYYAFDYRLNYQYRAFGIPDLGLKRGLVEDMVVSSYSTLLALPFAPKAAMDNIRKLLAMGMEGQYGLYEAVDFTPARMPKNEGYAVVKSYMAHHQGMGFIALANCLQDFSMVRRFHADPRVRAGELLLHERIPLRPLLTKRIKEPIRQLQETEVRETEVVRSFGVPRDLPPNCHLLSNGIYSVLLTDSGSGYSKNDHIQISRWRDLAPGYKYGTFIFVKSLNNDRIWSATYAPLLDEPDFYRVRFQQDRASFFRETKNIDIRTDVVVSTEDNAEIRQVSLTNHGTKFSSLEITSYMEVVLTHQSADLAHPAFSNLFIQTEAVLEYNCLLASRRPRSKKDKRHYALHLVSVEGESLGSLQYETDRAKFLGRGNDISRPSALGQPLSNSVGPVLDPILSLRRQIKLGPGETAVLSFVTAQGGDRREMINLAKKYSDPGASRRAFDLAVTRSLVENRFLQLSPKVLEASQNALGHLIFLSPARRDYSCVIASNTLGQRNLWTQGISGDNPIVLVRVEDDDDYRIVAEAVQAHEYWRFKGLYVDLVILNAEGGGYLEPVRDMIREMIQLTQVTDILDKPGGIFVRSINQLTEAEIALFYAVSRLILHGGKNLACQVACQYPRWPEKMEFPGPWAANVSKLQDPSEDLLFFNGFGGFNQDGSEYVIWLRDRMTPAPWLNVLANPGFGCTISERGAGFTYAENSRENKLTPWSNDPVSDPPGEAVYLRDEDSGTVWTVTAAPIREGSPYMIRHGMGYSVFAHHSHGIDQEMTVFVPQKDPVKLSLLRLRNDTERPRRLTVTWFIRPVLGVADEVTQQHLITAWENNLLTIRNPYNGDFPGRIAWIGTSEPVQSYTGDRIEFLGLDGSLGRPAALAREKLSNTAGAGLDPCAAIQLNVELEADGEREIVLQLGQCGQGENVRRLAEKYDLPRAKSALKDVRDFWRNLTGTISVKTPESAVNILLPWLLYQTLVCRLWARSGFYQSGGAYGFRDQLQDAMNLAVVEPQYARTQIILHATHQFREGDVQHWWHPGTNNRGVRTRFSDDLLWLPLATAEYIEKTGDFGILDEDVPFLEAPMLAEGEDERYGEADTSQESVSLYEHCLRAIKRGLQFGSHGIPLMGSGDWNDGMSTVGNQGKGESIWLGWFLYTILQKFAPLCRARGDDARAEHYLEQARKIASALEDQGWDGRWYRRAYFDDGTPLGSAENPECSIDSIAQSWAVISAGARRDRIEEAMAEVMNHLVREDQGLILLFTPPFDSSNLNPGYIKGYLPGVRENGGQYTHAACWVIQAMALLGRGADALRLFELINPINHSRTSMQCFTYRTEPYSLAADVYSVHPHTGRGGWTWYTGAAGWLYRVCVENILGIRRQGNQLLISPCIPGDWKEFSLVYRFGRTNYSILVRNPQGISTGVAVLTVDGREASTIVLADDGQKHRVEVLMGI